MTTELIIKIINEAIYAPSGGNSQPWRFEIKNENIFIYNLPEKDNAILNFKQTGSYLAHGCLIENISIIAEHNGYSTGVSLFDKTLDTNLVATISFEKKPNLKNDLFRYIRERHTNRKIYYDKKLSDNFKKDVSKIVNKKNELNFIMIEDKQKRNLAAKAASMAEKIALENLSLHKAFFKEILWSDYENRKGKEGLYIKTLELPIFIQYIFRLIKIWLVTKCLSKIGFSKIVAKSNANIYASSGAIGVITMNKYDAQKFIEVGRMMQKIWLIATKYKLSIQPIAGIIFMAHRVSNNDLSLFNKKHIEEIKTAYNNIKNAFGVKKESVVFMFRIGYADNVTSRSGRQTPEIKIFK